MSDTSRQLPDGSWVPAEPVPWHPGIDWEVYGTGPYRAVAYERANKLAELRGRWKPWLLVRMAWTTRRLAGPAASHGQEGHEHQWVDASTYGDATTRREICAFCPEERRVPR